jgi:hypothetical protein
MVLPTKEKKNKLTTISDNRKIKNMKWLNTAIENDKCIESF